MLCLLIWFGEKLGIPRRVSIDAPGALQQAMVKGIERGRIFQNNADRDHFIAS
jgi:hypothetical protein